MFGVLRVKCLLFFSGLIETRIFLIIFTNIPPNIKFHENPSIVSRIVLYGRTETGMPKPIVVFRGFVNAPKSWRLLNLPLLFGYSSSSSVCDRRLPTERIYCSLPRLIVLTPLLVSPFHLQARSTSDDARDLYQRNMELCEKCPINLAYNCDLHGNFRVL
jgi:hypothetical protein